MFPPSEHPEMVSPLRQVQYGAGSMCVWIDPRCWALNRDILRTALDAFEQGHPLRILATPLFAREISDDEDRVTIITYEADRLQKILDGLTERSFSNSHLVEVGFTLGDLGESCAWFEGDPQHRALTLEFFRNWEIRFKHLSIVGRLI